MMDSFQALKVISQHRGDAIVVTTMTANPEWSQLSKNPDLDMPLIGAMGKASSLGLGLALALPDKKVIVLDGDGAILMNLNSLTTAASKAPPNLVHIIWDNQQYQITGGQPTHTAEQADLEAIARGAGFKQALTVDTFAAFKEALSQILSQPGPWILVAKTDSSRALGRPPKSPVHIKNQFMEALRGA